MDETRTQCKGTVGGDPVFTEIARTEAVALKDALKDRVLEGDIKGATAQKELRLLNTLWDRYHDHFGVDERFVPPSPFHNLGKGFSELDEEEGRKLEVPVDIIRDKIVQPGALEFMNDELRDITLAIVETGARQSEITDLPPHSIFLDEPIPYIWIRKETCEWAREIKNRPSKRKIPLLGVALEAFQRHPHGFPRYRHKGTYSAAANKALRRYNVLPEARAKTIRNARATGLQIVDQHVECLRRRGDHVERFEDCCFDRQ
ncbi:hypothetical protein [uncultured Ruegeria sp.]|uniref:hypothetical protein n=1 Tax=uncultured Ruegeria sp. TaxID=259304 RepID=UPI00261EA36F|nr:hypothetical protein [uncultured Ruegeria sp.]